MRGTTVKLIRSVVAAANDLGLPKTVSYDKVKEAWKRTPRDKRRRMLADVYRQALREQTIFNV